MPCYHFHANDHIDEAGITLPDDQAARRYALRYACDLFRDMDVEPPHPTASRMEVRGDGDRPLFSLVFALQPS